MTTLSAETTITEDSEHLKIPSPLQSSRRCQKRGPAYVYKSKLTEFLWTLPQPIIALTMMSAVAIAITGGFMSPEALQGDADLLTSFLLFSPLFIILAAERIWTKKKGWLLSWRDYIEDAFWLFTAAYIWIPLITDYYSTPIEDAFGWVRDNSFIRLL